MENEHEHEHGQQPIPLSEILADRDALLGRLEDPARTHEAAEVFADYEVDVLTREREDLLASLANPANDTPEARDRLDQINHMLLSARADRTDIIQHPPDTELPK